MVGKIISHYKILEKLGEGGMGVVYKAEDTKLKRIVALKFLPHHLSISNEDNTRLLNEAQMTAKLNHPHICTVHDIEEVDDEKFIVMEFVDGVTLRTKIKDGNLTIEESVNYAIQIGEALEEAHSQGIVHRDIKPDNIMINSKNQIKVMDFGIAKLKEGLGVTRTMSTSGTLSYMAPEQLSNSKIDGRADIFSLGVLFYEMLSGRLPFRGEHHASMMYSLMNEEPEPINKYLTEASSEMLHVLNRVLKKNPKDRYQTITELLGELGLLSEGKTIPKRDSSKRKKLITGIGIFTTSVLIIAVILLSILTKHHKVSKLAILPFIDVSNDSTQEYLYDGLTEDVIKGISEASHDVKVISFNGVMPYKRKQYVSTKIAEELGVDAVVICRMYSLKNEYQLKLEIIDAKDNSYLGSGEYKAGIGEITTLPRKISAAIANMLGITITEEASAASAKRGTKNDEAYKLYLIGNYFYHRVDAKALYKSIGYYRQALKLEPDYALAHAGLSLSYGQLLSMDPSLEASRDSSLTEAIKAIELDSKLAEAHFAIGFVKYNNLEPKEAEKEFKQAIELNPSYADAIHYYGHYYADQRNFEKGISAMKHSLEIEPGSPHFQFCMSGTYFQAGQWNNAIFGFNKLYAMDSTYLKTWVLRLTGYSYWGKGDLNNAVKYFKTFISDNGTDQVAIMETEPLIDLLNGKIDNARKKVLLYEIKEGKKNPSMAAFLFASIKDKDKTLEWLEKAYETRSSDFYITNTFFQFDFLKGNLRFEELMRKAGYRN